MRRCTIVCFQSLFGGIGFPRIGGHIDFGRLFTVLVHIDLDFVRLITFDDLVMAAMGFSLFCQLVGRGKWGNFIAQWVPTWLIIGLYNKVVKQEGHDQFDRGYHH
jgi:hypothetical protein